MKFLTNIDLSRNQLLNAGFQNLATAPSTPFLSQLYYNTVDKRYYQYNGTDWIGMDSTGATMTGSNIITAINGAAGTIDWDNLNIIKANITGLGIPAQDTVYSLPTATVTILGGIKIGTGLNIASGVVSVDNTGANTYTDTAISNLIDSSPGTLDTLNELAAALGDDPNFATTVTTALGLRTQKYSTVLSASASQVITHNINSRDVIVSIRQTASPYEKVETDVEFTSIDTVTVKFAVAPAASQYTITIVG